MRKFLCSRLAIFTLFCFVFSSSRGQSDHFAYAITAVNKGGSEWVALRKIDTRSGEFSSVLLNMNEKSAVSFAGYKLTPPSNDHSNPSNPSNTAQANVLPQALLGNSVAAIAYDKKTNRLYFTQMNLDQLRYIDLNTMQVNSTLDLYFSKAGNYDFKTSGPISRMVIAPDDYGYTLTNDGNHLIRFSTKGTPSLTDLGALVDNPLNKENTILSPCANSGGDLVANDAGQLYLFVSTNRVFQIDIATKTATFLKAISGLPAKFATSGAAVTDNGKILISSSTYSDAFFIVDPETWEALPSPANLDIYGSADLANSNPLMTKKNGNFIFNETEKQNKIKVFPNPLLFDEVNVQFNELPAGKYTIQMANVLGRKTIEKKVVITEPTQTELMRIPGFTAQGFYYIRILDESNNVVGIQKLVVERW
jgi:hypothetical protein